ncbi:MAG: 7-carboxy-7-deazaguanine synthase QueE [Planctomycetes bacterium]|nr:7-carboxy-7-deazaguanine synthase QueE [Planctomycetota bacterium]
MDRSRQLRVNEIFHSVQGEGTRVGLRCAFIRLTGCDLRCTYCDTEYAFREGRWLTLAEVLDQVREFACPLVEVTGGEPLLQAPVHELLTLLADKFETVLLETSGARPIADVDPRVVRIVDIKCPSSGEVERNHWPNIAALTARDEVKFVIGDRRDYDWARAIVAEHGLLARCAVLVAPVYGALTARELAEWIVADRLDVRVGLQLHKLIWSPTMRGV